MSRFFVINDKRYTAKPFDFNTVCDLEDKGVPLAEMQNKPMSMARAYFALCFNGSTEDAGKELEAHLIAGGKFDDIYTVMGDEMNDSGFFQALKTEAEQDPQPVEKEEKKK